MKKPGCRSQHPGTMIQADRNPSQGFHSAARDIGIPGKIEIHSAHLFRALIALFFPNFA